MDHPELIPQEPLLLLADEAGMSATREHARLLALLRERDTKIVQLGDPRQLASPQAGGAFADTTFAHGAHALEQTHRQRDPHEVAALGELREGVPLVYLAHKAREQQLLVAPSTPVAIDYAATWWQERAAIHDPASVIVLTRNRGLAQDVNDAIRRQLITAGRLGAAKREAGGSELRAGDRVVCRRNDHLSDLQNGTRGTLTRLDDSSRSAVMLADDGRVLCLHADYLDAGHVQHAYAVTTHLAQGSTVDAALVLTHEDATSLNHGYTAASRARHETIQLVIPNDAEKRRKGPECVATLAERLALRDDPQVALRRLRSLSDSGRAQRGPSG